MPQPIVILSCFYKPFMSGAELCVEEMVRNRGDRELIIVTARMKRSLPKRDMDKGVVMVRVGFGTRFDKFIYPVACILPVLRMKPAIVHAVMESYAGIALVLLKKLRPSLKTVLTLQSGNLDEDRKLRRWPMSWLWKSIHTVPDRITAISSFLAERAKKLRGGSTGISVIPNGVDFSAVQSIPRELMRGRIVCISRLSREKGVDVLVRAFAIVANRAPNAELHLIGDGPERADIEALAKSAGCLPRIVFHGRLPHDEAMKLVRTAEVFALLSRGEGQGIVLIEAAAAGVPSVATHVGGIPEAVMDGKTGTLVPSEDVDAAADAITALLSDPVLTSRMGMEGEKFARMFEWKECVDAYHALWNELCAS